MVAMSAAEGFGDDLVRHAKPEQILAGELEGAGGLVGTDYVARAAADGYTLLYADVAHGINPAVYPKAKYDPVKSFVPITLVGAAPQVLVAHPSFPANSLKELLAMPREQLQKIAVGTPGQGSGPHLTYELLRVKVGFDLVHVPYKGGGPALNDVINGQIPLVMNAMPPVMPHLQSGKLKALAIATAERHPRLPDVQTYAESAPGVVVYNWYGFLAPAGTPAEATDKLAKDIARVLTLPDVKEKFDAAFLDPMPQGSAAMVRFLDEEVRQWKAVAVQTGISLD
jgi:tripartite-type tricarboxylate transporter receptor subunit TctC